MADQDDDLYDAVNGMADRMGLEGEERQRYIHEHMTKGGYDAIPQYVKRQEEGEEAERGGWSPFGGGGGSRRERRPSSRPSRQGDGDGWY